MKNKIKVQQLILSSLLTLTAFGCASTDETSRSPAAIQKNDTIDLKVQSYKQELRTIQGKIVPLHFFQSEQGSWYFALGCGPHEERGHTFEIYNKPFSSPSELDQQLKVALIRDSNGFSSAGECTQAFDKITAASSTNPVCLRETQEGVLVSQCRNPNRFDRGERNYGRRF